MTKKDFIIIADLLGELAGGNYLDIDSSKACDIITRHLKQTNPSFKEGTFLEAMRKARENY